MPSIEPFSNRRYQRCPDQDAHKVDVEKSRPTISSNTTVIRKTPSSYRAKPSPSVGLLGEVTAFRSVEEGLKKLSNIVEKFFQSKKDNLEAPLGGVDVGEDVAVLPHRAERYDGREEKVPDALVR